MASQYYYLVSGLADLAVDARRSFPPFAEFTAFLDSQLAPDDASLAAYVRHPFDNCNIITLTENLVRPFDDRGFFGKDELAGELKNPSRLPAYAVEYLASVQGSRPLFPGASGEDRLAWAFYEDACAHPNRFLASWFSFDLNLRNILAALSCRAVAVADGVATELLIERAVIGKNEVSERLVRSNAPDFGLSSLFPAVERLFSLSHGRLVELEKEVDMMRWRTLDELAFLTPFGIETILAYIIKLTIVHRWARLDPAEGKKMLDGLVASLRQEAVA